MWHSDAQRKRRRIQNFLPEDFFSRKKGREGNFRKDPSHPIQHPGEHPFHHETSFINLTGLSYFIITIYLSLLFFRPFDYSPLSCDLRIFPGYDQNLLTKLRCFNNITFLRFPIIPTERFNIRSRFYETSVTHTSAPNTFQQHSLCFMFGKKNDLILNYIFFPNGMQSRHW